MLNESLCNSSGILNVIYLVKSALNIITIAVPIILIVMSMLDVIKLIGKADVKIGDTLKKIINRLIAAALVFLAVPILNLGMSILGENTSIKLSKCWINATPDTIATLKEEEEKAALEEEKNQTDNKDETEEEKRKQALALRKSLEVEWSSTSSNEGVADSSTLVQVTEGSCVPTGRPYANNVDVGQEIVNEARKYLNHRVPYVWGGTSLETGVDCSGFVQQIMKKFGADISRTTYTQVNDGQFVGYDLSNAKPGDIVVFDGHVGIYSGNGMMVHASQEGTDVIESAARHSTAIQAVRRIICNG